LQVRDAPAKRERIPRPQREDSIAIEHEGVDRLANLIVTIVPPGLLLRPPSFCDGP